MNKISVCAERPMIRKVARPTMKKLLLRRCLLRLVLSVLFMVLSGWVIGLLYPAVEPNTVVRGEPWGWPVPPPSRWPSSNKNVYIGFAETRSGTFCSAREVGVILSHGRGPDQRLKTEAFKMQQIKVGFPLRSANINILQEGTGRGSNIPKQRVEDQSLLSGITFADEGYELPYQGRFIPMTLLWPGAVVNTIFVFAVLALLQVLIAAVRTLIRRSRAGKNACPDCGHLRPPPDLEGFEPTRCPECGGVLPLRRTPAGVQPL